MRKKIARAVSRLVGRAQGRITVKEEAVRTEAIRAAMLEVVYEVYTTQKSAESAKVWSDISRASDFETLWYLRSDVLRVLSGFNGEVTSRKQLEPISELFRGLVPQHHMPLARRMNK